MGAGSVVVVVVVVFVVVGSACRRKVATERFAWIMHVTSWPLKPDAAVVSSFVGGACDRDEKLIDRA